MKESERHFSAAATIVALIADYAAALILPLPSAMLMLISCRYIRIPTGGVAGDNAGGNRHATAA